MTDADDDTLACGHPDPTPDTSHDDDDPTRPVCPDCCTTCNPREAA